MHFIVGAKLPIFSGDDHVERCVAHIKVTLVAVSNRRLIE